MDSIKGLLILLSVLTIASPALSQRLVVEDIYFSYNLTFYDAQTTKEITDGIIIEILVGCLEKGTQSNAIKYIKGKEIIWKFYDAYFNFPITLLTIVRASGYEEYKYPPELSQQVEYNWNKHRNEYVMPYMTVGSTRTIYLIPKLEKNELSGNLVIKDSTQQKPATDIGIMTSEDAAAFLGVQKIDLEKLIQSGQIKGKKIGTKFFVTKEQIHEYLNR